MTTRMDERIPELLAERGVSFRIHEHQVARTVAEAEERLPFPPQQFLKTVAIRTRQGRWLLVGLRGQDRIDYRRLADAVGVKRADLTQPPHDEVSAALGYATGGICLIPPDDDVAVFVDEGALALDTVFCGAGRADRTLEIRLADLVLVSDAKVVAVAALAPSPARSP